MIPNLEMLILQEKPSELTFTLMFELFPSLHLGSVDRCYCTSGAEDSVAACCFFESIILKNEINIVYLSMLSTAGVMLFIKIGEKHVTSYLTPVV